jgi:hypothetical protein
MGGSSFFYVKDEDKTTNWLKMKEMTGRAKIIEFFPRIPKRPVVMIIVRNILCHLITTT